MSTEVQQLIGVINKMQASQEAANTRFDEHLTKLRENMHGIKSDYHEVASTSKVTHDKLIDIHSQLDKETAGIHARIDKTVDELETIKGELADFKPVADTFRQISTNVIRLITGLVVAAVVWVVVKMNGEG